jgi:hypothetical protein
MTLALLLPLGASADGPVPSVRVTRPSGLAPLAVLFDAKATTHPGHARPFHELRYAWDFGDPASGTWRISARSKNHAEGPVAGHVFEEPGRYTIRLRVTDPEGRTSTSTVDVAVQDPATHSWAARYCYSNDSDHTGCPPGFIRVSDVRSLDHTLGGRLAANTAHLFRRGHRFEVTGLVRMHRVGAGGLISAYGSGAPPILSGGPHFVAGDDWTLAHLDLRGVPDAFAFDGDSAKAHRRFTVYDVTATGYSVCFDGFLRATVAERHQQTALVDFTCKDFDPRTGQGWAVFLFSSDSLFMGLDVDPCSPEGHTEGDLRFMYADTVVFQHSRLSRSCENLGAKNLLSIRSCGQDNGAGWCGRGDKPNQFMVLSDNVFESYVGTSVIRTCTHDECDVQGTNGNHSRDLIFERNFTTLRREGPLDAFRWLHSQSADVTVRNNVVDFSGLLGGSVIFVHQSLAGSSVQGIRHRDNMHVYNNTFVLNGAKRMGVALCQANGGSAHRCWNNLVHVPEAGRMQLTEGSWDAGANLHLGNRGPGHYSGNPFVGGEGSHAMEHFRLAGANPVSGGSNPVNGGETQAGDGLDADLRCRSGRWDVGAFEWDAQPCPNAGSALRRLRNRAESEVVTQEVPEEAGRISVGLAPDPRTHAPDQIPHHP